VPAGFPHDVRSVQRMLDLTVGDPIMNELALDGRVNPTAVRLYVLLRNGSSLDAAAKALGRTTEWMRRYELQLRDLGYIEIHDISARGKRQRRYVFLTPADPGSLAS
jgi:hypothetical protein